MLAAKRFQLVLQHKMGFCFHTHSGLGCSNKVVDIRFKHEIKETLDDDHRIVRHLKYPGRVYMTGKEKTVAQLFLSGTATIINPDNYKHLADIIIEITQIYLEHRDLSKPSGRKPSSKDLHENEELISFETNSNSTQIE